VRAEGANRGRRCHDGAKSEGATGANPDLERFLAPGTIPWGALETYLRHAEGHTLNLPDDEVELAKLADAIRAINWLSPGPAGLDP
jgi:hypothetical protein